MATPIGHAVAGYAIYSISPHGAHGRGSWRLALLCIFMAVAPDLDVLPGLLQGKPVLFHGGITHSLGTGLVLSLLVAGICRFSGRTVVSVFSLCLAAYASHLLLDFVGPDGREPYGIPLFWPISVETFLSPVPLLPGMRHVDNTLASNADFVRGVLNPYNMAAILLEIAVGGGIVILGRILRNTKSDGLT
jgi:inner membrane protein